MRARIKLLNDEIINLQSTIKFIKGLYFNESNHVCKTVYDETGVPDWSGYKETLWNIR